MLPRQHLKQLPSGIVVVFRLLVLTASIGDKSQIETRYGRPATVLGFAREVTDQSLLDCQCIAESLLGFVQTPECFLKKANSELSFGA